MANSRHPGPLIGLNPWTAPRTPGPLGYNDQSDPNMCTRLGDTPGPLGFQDSGDPNLPTLAPGLRYAGGSLGRSKDGIPLSLPASGVMPINPAVPQEKIGWQQLKKIFSAASDDYVRQIASELNTNLTTYGLDSVLRRAHFFAQVRQEGGAGLEAKVESLNYSPEGLKNTFKYYRENPGKATTDAYEKDPRTHKITRGADQETIANNVYANRNGNGSVASGDGWKFRGRGLIQVTGRGNYAEITRQYGKLYADGVDFETLPDLMADFPYTVRSAVCFWIQHDLQTLADKGSSSADVDRITAVINRNTDSYAERQANFITAYDAFK